MRNTTNSTNQKERKTEHTHISEKAENTASVRKRVHLSSFIDGAGLFGRYHDAANLFRVFLVFGQGQQTCAGNTPVQRTLALAGSSKRETLTHAA